MLRMNEAASKLAPLVGIGPWKIIFSTGIAPSVAPKNFPAGSTKSGKNTKIPHKP